ncbi:Pancreatic triacylglycerol lipase [Orchesella cincta]|uniref:Pancreatic triacylglycerol lipase n=1 Tax=Orchesella cincta TaxID=48709 RepID=A0A1D2NAZ2_ORCCI|nr:Pancreatic triacylglycerol lipase [Orchesella cincta]
MHNHFQKVFAMKIATALLIFAIIINCSLQQETVAPGEENIETTTTEPNEEEGDEELQSNDPNSVAFYLYPSVENTSYHEEIRIGETDSLLESSYSPQKTPIFLIHGFVNNYTCKFSQRVKNAFLEAGKGEQYNIIVVDWGALSTPKNQTNLGLTPLNDLAKNPFYQAAVRNVPKVGRRIAEFIEFLINETYLDNPSSVYLAGFSLGAQVAGSAGYEVKQNMSDPIGRITGLDPAGPLYQSQTNNALKLESSDASFVDIISNGGGPNQNDCVDVTNDGWVTSNVAGVCAHNRCWVYYIKSITNDIYGCKCFATPDYICKATCSNKVLFGYPTPPTARGTYYVEVTGKE